MTLGGACLLTLSAWNLCSGEMNSTPRAIAAFAPGVAGLWLFLNAGFFVYSTRAGKFAVWAELFDRLDLKGDERLLDIGCGRGAVLLMAAQLLPRGRAVGVDVWSRKDPDRPGVWGGAVQRLYPAREAETRRLCSQLSW
jgi:hypothetical protein